MPEVIPELVYVIGLFFAIVGYVTARGLLATWTHSLGYVFRWLAVHLRFHVSVPFKTFVLDLGGPFRAIDSWAVVALQNWCDGAEKQMGYCLHGMAKVALYTAQAIDFLTRETVHAFDRLNHVKLRQFLKLFALPVLLPLLLPKLIRAILPHITHGVVRITHVITHDIERTVVHVVKRAQAVVLPYPHAIPRIQHEIFGLTRRNLRLAKRLRRVESLFGVAAMAAVMANVLGLPNWRCLTRGNVGKTARALCGFPSHLLNDLLGVLADVWILENVCVLLPILERGAADVGSPLVAALTDVTAGLCKGSIGAAKPLQGPMPVVPPVTYGTALVGV